MPFNGSGTFSIVNTFIPNTTILSAAVNQNFTDIATGLSDCLTRDGQAGMSAALKLISGTIGAPSLTFIADTLSGIYQPAVGSVGIVADSLGVKVNAQTFGALSATVSAGGSGYAVGDTIYITGGTSSVVACFTVATLSGTAAATVTMTVPGCYTVKPSNPAAQGSTSGVGTGATLIVTYNDVSSAVYHLNVTDLSDALLWQALGASSFVSGLMGKANGLDFAVGIGAANLATALAASFQIAPQGYLTPTSGTPIITTDVTGATSLFYTPFMGNIIPIYNGANFVNTTFTELQCTLTSGAQSTLNIYDVYIFNDAGTIRIGFSPTWNAGSGGSVTAGSCARGTGAGGTALTRINGILVNAVSMTVNNSSSTFTIAANRGTYVGTVFINSTAGQLNLHRNSGQTRAWDIWNMYNRQTTILQVTDSTASWNTSSAVGPQPARNQTVNSLTLLSGFPEDQNILAYSIQTQVAITNGSATAASGIGINSTSSFSTQGSIAQSTAAASLAQARVFSNIILGPQLGINVITALEQNSGVSGTTVTTWTGTSVSMLMTAEWKA